MFHFSYLSVNEEASEDMIGYSEVEPQNMMEDLKSLEACVVEELLELFELLEALFDEQPDRRPQPRAATRTAAIAARPKRRLPDFCFAMEGFLSFACESACGQTRG